MAVSKPRRSPMLPVITSTRPQPAMPRTRPPRRASSRSLLLLVLLLQSVSLGIAVTGWSEALRFIDRVLDAQPQQSAPAQRPRPLPWS